MIACSGTAAQAQNVGIGTASPEALLHVSGGDVHFGTDNQNGIYKFIYRSEKQALLVGRGNTTIWHADSVGMYSFNAGLGNVSSGAGSIVAGINNRGRGYASVALGEFNIAQLINTTAIGLGNKSMSPLSTTLGIDNLAANNGATAIGYATQVYGRDAMALGKGTIADAYFETALGSYNSRTSAHESSWFGNDRLLVIGNGQSDNARSNAVVVLKNGHVGIGTNADPTSLQPQLDNRLVVGGNLAATGRVAIGERISDTELHLYHGTSTAGSITNGLKLENTGNNGNNWILYTVNSNGALSLYANGNGTAKGSFSNSTGAYVNSSSRNLKTDITDLPDHTVQRLMQLQPKNYRYIADDKQKKTLGFIAEDVAALFPELVETLDEEGKLLGINYAGFSVVAIQAIQQLMQRVRTLENEIQTLKKQ